VRDFDSWPIEAQQEVTRLRKESAAFRIARNEARQEADRLRERLGEQRPEGLLTLNQTNAAIRRGGRK
jgi:hypothetical protein